MAAPASIPQSDEFRLFGGLRALRKRKQGTRPTPVAGVRPVEKAEMVEYQILDRMGDAVLLQLSGELAHHFRTEQLRQALERHFVDDGVKVIRVDLSPVTFMDSYGVATLVSLLKESRERGKKFQVEGAQGQVREKLGVTGVLKVLQRGA